MAETVANLITRADPWTSRDQTCADDTWICFVYWRETDCRTGKRHTAFAKSAIREVEEWFKARGTPKAYETIRTRLRENYDYWRDNLSDEDIEQITISAGGGGKK